MAALRLKAKDAGDDLVRLSATCSRLRALVNSDATENTFRLAYREAHAILSRDISEHTDRPGHQRREDRYDPELHWRELFCELRARQCHECKRLTRYIFPLVGEQGRRLCEVCQWMPAYSLVTEEEAVEDMHVTRTELSELRHHDFDTTRLYMRRAVQQIQARHSQRSPLCSQKQSIGGPTTTSADHEAGGSDEECTSTLHEGSKGHTSGKAISQEEKERRRVERKLHKKAIKLQNRERRASSGGLAASAVMAAHADNRLAKLEPEEPKQPHARNGNISQKVKSFKKKFLTHHEHVKMRGDLRQNWQVKRENLEAAYGLYGISCLRLDG